MQCLYSPHNYTSKAAPLIRRFDARSIDKSVTTWHLAIQHTARYNRHIPTCATEVIDSFLNSDYAEFVAADVARYK